MKDQKDSSNAVSVVKKNGQYVEKIYRDENLSDDVHDAALEAIEKLKSHQNLNFFTPIKLM